MVERSKQCTAALSQAEEVMRMQAGWKYWDYVLQAVGGQNSAVLQEVVAQPEGFIVNRQNIVISLSDQTPVWLKPVSGKRLMPQTVLQAAHQAKKARRSRAAAVSQGAVEDADAA